MQFIAALFKWTNNEPSNRKFASLSICKPIDLMDVIYIIKKIGFFSF